MKTQSANDPFDVVPAILRAAGNLGFIGAGSATAGRLLAALCSPSISFDELSKLLNSEPALVVRVLRVANSAFYGVSRSIKTIDRALMVLDLIRCVQLRLLPVLIAALRVQRRMRRLTIRRWCATA
jgi:c-di-GMP-related signal transduction protein